MTQKLPAQSLFEQSILDNAFYQPDIVNNKHKTGENDFNVTAQSEYISHIKEALDKEQSVFNESTYTTSSGSYFIFFFSAAALIASVFFISYEWAWKLFVSSINHRGASVFLTSLAMVIPNIFGAAAFTDAISAWRLSRFKKTKKGKKLIHDIEHLSTQLEQAQSDLDEHCKKTMTESYFFHTLKKFDDIATRIKNRYPKNFLAFAENSDDYEYDLDTIRETLVDYFSNKAYQDFCSMAENLDYLEHSFETVWQDYCSTDKAMLMKKYQNFLNNDTSDIENAL